VPVDLLRREASEMFAVLASTDLQQFLASGTFQEFLARLGSYSAELVAAGVTCSQAHLLAFRRAADEAAVDDAGAPSFEDRMSVVLSFAPGAAKPGPAPAPAQEEPAAPAPAPAAPAAPVSAPSAAEVALNNIGQALSVRFGFGVKLLDNGPQPAVVAMSARV
jgi:hypothetical protein